MTMAISRRHVIAALAAMPVMAGCARTDPSREIGFASTGGPYNALLRRVWTDDFEKKTGVKVNLSASTSLAQARLQAETDWPQWDVLELPGPWYQIAVRQGFLLPLDTSIVNVRGIDSQYVGTHGVKYAMFNNCMAWNADHVGTSRAPQGWGAMWDLQGFRGRRSLDTVHAGAGTFEIALLADGVEPAKLYPLDIDRAFRKLDALGRDNIIWAQSLQETIQRLVSGEVTMGPSWPYRIMLANKGGANLRLNFDQCFVAGDYVGVVKTSRNPDAAFRFINDLVNNVPAAAEFSRLTHYGVPNLDTLRLLPPEDAALVPTNPVLAEKLIVPSETYWADHLADLSKRFAQWQLS